MPGHRAWWYQRAGPGAISHLFANVFVSEEETCAEVLLGDVVCVDDDELANARQDDVLDRLRGDSLQSDHDDGGISHPVGIKLP